MSKVVRIGNAHGFWGDRLSAAAEMLALEPKLDFLTLDFLAEVSMSILALQRARDPTAGWPRDVLTIIRSLGPYWRGGGRCRVITNGGGLDPMGCARACLEVLREAGCAGRTIAVVSGDDVLEDIRAGDAGDDLLRNMDTGEGMAAVRDRLVTANAYLGAEPIAEALAQGADLVITGRVADPSLTVAACAHAFGWPWDAWDRLAGATVAGHLIECGTQVTGGISTDWLQSPDLGRIGFPIVEVAEDGSCVVTKPQGTGGCVCERTVKEQLLYEMGDPGAYLSPDVTLSLLSLQVEDEGGNRVHLRGAAGGPAPPTYKVSATYRDGFRAEGQLTVVGPDAVAKAQRAARAMFERLRADGVSLRQCVVDCLGAGACRPQGLDAAVADRLPETVLRIAVADDAREAVECFARELMPLVTAGPQGITGYAQGRPRVHPMFRFWPCLIGRERIQTRIQIEKVPGTVAAATGRHTECAEQAGIPVAPRRRHTECAGYTKRRHAECDEYTGKRHTECAGYEGVTPARLRDIAYARSGDKGIHANIGVIARRGEDFPRLCREVTPQRVAAYFGLNDSQRVLRYELPNLGALNLVLEAVLADPLRADAQGKALGQILLEMPLEAGRT